MCVQGRILHKHLGGVAGTSGEGRVAHLMPPSMMELLVHKLSRQSLLLSGTADLKSMAALPLGAQRYTSVFCVSERQNKDLAGFTMSLTVGQTYSWWPTLASGRNNSGCLGRVEEVAGGWWQLQLMGS